MTSTADSRVGGPDRPFVAYVGPFQFPWGQAGSRRVYGIARSLMAAGRDVVVVNGAAEPAAPRLLESDGEGSLFHVGVLDGPQRGDTLAAKAFRLFVAHGDLTVRWLETQAVAPSHVIVYGGHAPFMARLLPWCRRRGVALLADVVEWYDPKQFAGGMLGPLHLSAKIALRWQYPRCAGVIAISGLLERYYRGRGVVVARVPPTLDVEATRWRDAEASPVLGALRLVYAGTPGRKDLLANVIAAVAAADASGARVRLDVLGPTPEQVASLVGGRAHVPGSVHTLGRVPQDQVAAAVRGADFSVLLRPRERYADAGFPTKLVESLSVGTPMICNVTGDIGNYVRDGLEGFLCRDHSAASFGEALARAIATTPADRALMRRAARGMAEQFFDYRAHAGALNALLTETSRFAAADPRSSTRRKE